VPAQHVLRASPTVDQHAPFAGRRYQRFDARVAIALCGRKQNRVASRKDDRPRLDHLLTLTVPHHQLLGRATRRRHVPQGSRANEHDAIVWPPGGTVKSGVGNNGRHQPVGERDPSHDASGVNEPDRATISRKEAEAGVLCATHGNSLEAVERAHVDLPDATEHANKRDACSVW